MELILLPFFEKVLSFISFLSLPGEEVSVLPVQQNARQAALSADGVQRVEEERLASDGKHNLHLLSDRLRCNKSVLLCDVRVPHVLLSRREQRFLNG